MEVHIVAVQPYALPAVGRAENLVRGS